MYVYIYKLLIYVTNLHKYKEFALSWSPDNIKGYTCIYTHTYLATYVGQLWDKILK